MSKGDENEYTRRAELGSFLRTRREKLQPEKLGLPARARRRTPGLRREEVAELAGIGVTWYTWLEQGRPIQVSPEVLENLAQIFRLGADERSYLFQLAQRALPLAPPASLQVVRPVFGDVVAALEPNPAHIRDLRWNVLAWNRAETFLVDWQAYPPNERNVVWQHFTNPSFRRIMVNWEREARSLLSEFRMQSGQHAGDAWFTDLIRQLKEISPEFRRWWPLHEVRRERELPVEFHLPEVGRLSLQPVSLTFPGEPNLLMRILMPVPETDTAARLHYHWKEAASGQNSPF